jgi:hypothetical protein
MEGRPYLIVSILWMVWTAICPCHANVCKHMLPQLHSIGIPLFTSLCPEKR